MLVCSRHVLSQLEVCPWATLALKQHCAHTLGWTNNSAKAEVITLQMRTIQYLLMLIDVFDSDLCRPTMCTSCWFICKWEQTAKQEMLHDWEF